MIPVISITLYSRNLEGRQMPSAIVNLMAVEFHLETLRKERKRDRRTGSRCGPRGLETVRNLAMNMVPMFKRGVQCLRG